jgi:alkylation response protein AidB-like acyl-CoA dehydrogenase
MASLGLRWLLHLEPFLSPVVSEADWAFLAEFESTLTTLSPKRLRKESSSLLALKVSLALSGYGGVDVPVEQEGRGRSSLLQMLIQFLCGYYDLDFRDIAHVGHGRLVITRGSRSQLDRWASAILSGGLVGIAVTEPHGGTLIQSMRTTAHKQTHERWVLSGEKCWISRIREAMLFIVFFRIAGTDGVAAALIDARTPGIFRETLEPAGLHGWSWGQLKFDNAEFLDSDLLGTPETGLEIFREHFMYYRPMVSMTALGGAAAMFDEIMKSLTTKVYVKSDDSVRDSAWEAFGRGFIEIQSAVLSALVTQQLVGLEHGMASLWSRSSKAFGCQTAFNLASRLAIFGGATAYHEQSRTTKILEDLRAFLYADGVIDALFRSAGRELYGGGWLDEAVSGTS